jgi:hypothetical protein
VGVVVRMKNDGNNGERVMISVSGRAALEKFDAKSVVCMFKTS